MKDKNEMKPPPVILTTSRGLGRRAKRLLQEATKMQGDTTIIDIDKAAAAVSRDVGYTLCVILAILLLAIGVGQICGCTIVGAKITADGRGLDISAEVIGVNTSITLPIPDFPSDEEIEDPEASAPVSD